MRDLKALDIQGCASL